MRLLCRMMMVVFFASAAVSSTACKHKTSSGSASALVKAGAGQAGVTKATAKPKAGVGSRISVAVKRAFGKPPAAMQVTLPADWMEGTHDEVVRLLPKTQPDKYQQTKLQIGEGNTSCPGTCDTKQVSANIAAVYESFKKRLARPNRGSGDPKKDAYRAKVQVLEDAETQGKVYKRVFAAKVTCPNKGTIPCMPQLAARCFYYEEGADYYIVATGKGPLAAEKSAWPQLMALCKGLAFAAANK